MATRLDVKLKQEYPGLKRRHLEEALDHQLITVNGKKAKKGQALYDDDSVETQKFEQHLKDLRNGLMFTLPIVFEGTDFLVIDKPAGIKGHPLNLFDTETVTAWALKAIPEIAKEFVEVQPIITPHRLDTGTRGLLIVAKTKKSFNEWRERFQNHEVTKTYEAWCWADKKPERTFSLTTFVDHDSRDRRKMKLVEEGAGRKAESDFEVLKAEGEMALVRATTRYGVTHQIRVQLASVGLPLMGDKLYDPNYDRRKLQPKHHLLVAKSIAYGDQIFTSHYDAPSIALA